MMPLTGEAASYNRSKYLKPSEDRYLFRPDDASAVWDLLNRNQVGMQFDLYSRRLMGDYVPTVNNPHYFPPDRLELGGGPDMGQNGNNYGNIAGASNRGIPAKIMSRAKEAPVLVTGVLNLQNVMQEWRPLEMYLRELWYAAHTQAISPTDLNDAIHSLSKGKFANVQDAIADVASATPTFFTTLKTNNAFVNGLADRVAIPSYDALLPRIIDYSDRRIGDVVAISAINPTRSFNTLPNMGFAAHDFNTGIPGLHLGDTMPVSLFDVISSIKPMRQQQYNDDGSINTKIQSDILRRLIRGRKVFAIDEKELEKTLRQLATCGR